MVFCFKYSPDIKNLRRDSLGEWKAFFLVGVGGGLLYNQLMSAPILLTKLYIPLTGPKTVLRPHLIKRLNNCTQCKLTLVSASAGFGKTTLISEWAAGCKQPVAWLSLDEEHKDPACFLTYFIAALQTITTDIGDSLSALLQSLQQPPMEFVLKKLLNEITAIPEPFIFVLDDYHVLDSEDIDKIITVILENMPPLMHLVIATREDPHLPLARLRGRGQMAELRASDLCFTSPETVDFLNQIMGLHLSAEDITVLESRTEGWIAGLQLAAIFMQGNDDNSGFIKSFTGSHHFILDYLIEEVVNQQSEYIKSFLLCTSILERVCGSLCDSVLPDTSSSGSDTLKYLDRLNMFIIPMDNERRWYRYHHLFAELLRQRLQQSNNDIAELHIRASEWYEKNNLYLEAFHHSTAANDIDRTIRLIEGKGIPRHSRGPVISILNWLQSLPEAVLDSKPILLITFATVSLGLGQVAGAEQKLKAAETAIERIELDEINRDMIGQIASMRAIIVMTQYNAETMKTQSLRALEYLSPKNLSSRTTSTWTLAKSYELLGDRTTARITYNETLVIGQRSGNIVFTLLAKAGLSYIDEVENQFHKAAQIYREILEIAGDKPLPVLCDVHLGLARIFYQWNDMDTALQFAQSSIVLARLFEHTIDRFIICEIFLARVKLALGDVDTASAQLASTAQSVHQSIFIHRMPELAAGQVLVLIKKGKLKAAAEIARKNELQISQVRVFLAQGDTSSALAILEPVYQDAETMDWDNEKLEIMVLNAIALYLHGTNDKATQLIVNVLGMTEPEGFIRIFVDEGLPMFRLLSEINTKGILPDYVAKLLAAFKAKDKHIEYTSKLIPSQPLIYPLSQRELEVLQLIKEGLSNQEIGDRLFIALDTVKGHNRRIYDKLDVENRAQAINKASTLNIFSS